MNSKYKISKYKNSKLDDTEDHISIEEPLEINLKYKDGNCLLYTSPSPRDGLLSRMPSSA